MKKIILSLFVTISVMTTAQVKFPKIDDKSTFEKVSKKYNTKKETVLKKDSIKKNTLLDSLKLDSIKKSEAIERKKTKAKPIKKTKN